MGKWWERWSCVLVWKEGWRGQRGGGGGGVSPWRLALTICHPAGSLSFSLGPEWVRYTFNSSNSTFAYGSRWGTARYCKVNGENVKRIVHPPLKIVLIFICYSETHYTFLCIELSISLQQLNVHYFTYNKSGQRPVFLKDKSHYSNVPSAVCDTFTVFACSRKCRKLMFSTEKREICILNGLEKIGRRQYF